MQCVQFSVLYFTPLIVEAMLSNNFTGKPVPSKLSGRDQVPLPALFLCPACAQGFSQVVAKAHVQGLAEVQIWLKGGEGGREGEHITLQYDALK